MKQVYYIRHGKSESNIARQWGGHIDTPLSAEGHEQAKKAAVRAKQQGLSFDIIISSPLSRAHHTAQYIASEIGYPHDQIIFSDLFKERSYGVLDGTEYGEVFERYLLDESALDDYEGVELTADFQERANKAWAYLQTLPQDSVLVVSHGAFGRALKRAIARDPIHVRGTHLKNAELERIF